MRGERERDPDGQLLSAGTLRHVRSIGGHEPRTPVICAPNWRMDCRISNAGGHWRRREFSQLISRGSNEIFIWLLPAAYQLDSSCGADGAVICGLRRRAGAGDQVGNQAERLAGAAAL